MSYSINDVCTRFGLTAHTLRYYEKIGLLTGIERSRGGIRTYSDDNLETLGLICCLKNTGMPLAEIAEFVRLTREGDETLRERCSILNRLREKVTQQITEMQAYLKKLSHKIEYFSGKLTEYEQRTDEIN